MKDFRSKVPLYTIAEATRILAVSPSRMRAWIISNASPSRNVRYTREPLVTAIDNVRHGDWRIPFVGLAEAYILLFLRECGISMQRIRKAINALKEETSIEHALASKRLYTDRYDLLYQYEEKNENLSDTKLVALRDGQTVIAQVIEDWLELITYSDDGYAKRLRIGRYGNANVVVDPEMSFGRPIFADTGVRLCDVFGRIKAGEDLSAVAQDYDIPAETVRIAWGVEYSKAA